MNYTLNSNNPLFTDQSGDVYLIRNYILYKKQDASADVWDKIEDNVKAMFYDPKSNSKYKIKSDSNTLYKWTGQSWVEIMNGLSPGINQLFIDPDDSNILVAATNSGIYKTTDGAFSWIKTAFGQNAEQLLVSNTDKNIYWVLSNNTPYFSIDAGKT